MSLGEDPKPLQNLARTVGAVFACGLHQTLQCDSEDFTMLPFPTLGLGSHTVGLKPGSVTEQPRDLGKSVSPCAAD